MNRLRRDIFLVCCISSILLCTAFLIRVSPPSRSDHDPLKLSTEPTEIPVEPLSFTDGWAVREACQRRGGLDVLFFVYLAPKSKQRRFAGRDTIGDPVISEHWNWSTIYLVSLADNEDDASWNRLEAEAFGDLLILPVNDTLRGLTKRFLMGMKWVLSNCPNVKYVVKIDDDVFVNPSLLRLYIGAFVDPRSKYVHCLVWTMMRVYRDVNHPFYVPREDFPDKTYFRYCSGRAMIMPGGVLADLYAASKKLQLYAVDDAYVTGDLALIAGVGHVDMNPMITWLDRREFDVVSGKFIFAHLDKKDNFVVRPGLWDLNLRKEALRSSDERLLVNKQVELLKRSGTVNTGDMGVIEVMKPGL